MDRAVMAESPSSPWCSRLVSSSRTVESDDGIEVNPTAQSPSSPAAKASAAPTGKGRVSATPQSKLRPQPIPKPGIADPSAPSARDLEALESLTGDWLPTAVKSVVNYSMELQHRGPLFSRQPRPIPLSILNRRRRAVRAWMVAVIQGRTDRATLHALTHVWIPQLAGTGHDLIRSVPTGHRCIDFVRGVLTGQIFDAASASLLPQARAVHALDWTLGVHLQAIREMHRELKHKQSN